MRIHSICSESLHVHKFRLQLIGFAYFPKTYLHSKPSLIHSVFWCANIVLTVSIKATGTNSIVNNRLQCSQSQDKTWRLEYAHSHMPLLSPRTNFCSTSVLNRILSVSSELWKHSNSYSDSALFQMFSNCLPVSRSTYVLIVKGTLLNFHNNNNNLGHINTSACQLFAKKKD